MVSLLSSALSGRCSRLSPDLLPVLACGSTTSVDPLLCAGELMGGASAPSDISLSRTGPTRSSCCRDFELDLRAEEACFANRLPLREEPEGPLLCLLLGRLVDVLFSVTADRDSRVLDLLDVLAGVGEGGISATGVDGPLKLLITVLASCAASSCRFGRSLGAYHSVSLFFVGRMRREFITC